MQNDARTPACEMTENRAAVETSLRRGIVYVESHSRLS